MSGGIMNRKSCFEIIPVPQILLGRYHSKVTVWFTTDFSEILGIEIVEVTLKRELIPPLFP